MQKTTVIRTAIAAGVAGVGLSMGGIALASADDTSTTQAADELRPDVRTDADGERPEPPTEEERAERQQAFADALAEELDVSSANVTAALEALHDEAEAEGRTGSPSGWTRRSPTAS